MWIRPICSSVSVMPCTAKKYECERPEFIASGHQDVDLVITTRELAQMIKDAGIDFMGLPDEEADRFVGLSTGAATIFGATGGVKEAAPALTPMKSSAGKLWAMCIRCVEGFGPCS